MTGSDGKIRELYILKRGQLRERDFLNTKPCASSASGNTGRFPAANGTEIFPEKFPEIPKTI